MTYGASAFGFGRSARRAGRAPGGRAGFTLVEMVITAGVAVVVLSALYLLLERNISLFEKGEAKTDVQQSTRIVLEDMGAMLRAAGNGVPRGTVAGNPEAISIFYNGITVGGEPLVTSSTAITFLGDIDGTAAQLTGAVSTGGTSVSIAPVSRDYSKSVTGGTNTVVVSTRGTWAFGGYTGPAGARTSLSVGALQTPSGAAATFSPGDGVAALELVKYSLQGTNLVRRIGLFGGQASATNPTVTWGPAETLLDNVVSLTFTYFDTNNVACNAGGSICTVPPTTPGDQGNIRRVRIAIQAQAGKGVRDYNFSYDARLRAL